MLTRGDDYPLHQTPEPIAYAGTDRNFYDRYFFNGYLPDGDGFFAVAFGIYPQLNVADAHFSCLRGGRQHALHASRLLDMERMDLSVGPIRIEVIEPLRVLRVVVEMHEGIAADLTFEGRAFPVEEPRFTRRLGPRSFMDYTRMTQNGRWRGWIEVDGVRQSLDGGVGTRDRSWGVRPVGARDPQPVVPEAPPQFFWLWSPVNFADESLFFHVNADEHGAPWNVRAVRVPDGDVPQETADAAMTLDLLPGRRIARGATLKARFSGGTVTATFEPQATFLMRGIGYGHPDWGHGCWRGPLAVGREDFAAEALPGRVDHLHVQAPSRVTLTSGRGVTHGFGVLEQLMIGDYAPLGLSGIVDG